MKKILAIILTSVLIAAGVFAGGWYLAKSVYDKPAAPPIEQSGVGVIDGDGNDITQGIHKMPSVMTFLADKARVKIIATLTPDFLPDKSVDVALELVDPEGDKNALNAVSVTRETDGSPVITVTRNTEFEWKLKLVVTARSNPDIRTECEINCAHAYVQSPGSIRFTFSDDSFWDYDLVNYSMGAAIPIHLGATVILSMVDYVWTGGTIAVPVRVKDMTITFSSGFRSYCTAQSIVLPDHSETLDDGLDMADFYTRWFGADNWSNVHNRNLILNYNATHKTRQDGVFALSWLWTTGYKTIGPFADYQMSMDTDVEIIAEDMELDNGGIIF